jgi:hypothetical protein
VQPYLSLRPRPAYLRRVLLRDQIETRDDITDGANDKQMDAVVIDDVNRRVIIVQGKFIGQGHVDGEPLREMLSAWVRLQNGDISISR